MEKDDGRRGVNTTTGILALFTTILGGLLWIVDWKITATLLTVALLLSIPGLDRE